MRKIKRKIKVFVAMSGGVDSSVAALLLSKNKKYEVVGVYMKGWSLTDCAEDDARDARRVAGTLNIPFYVFDFEEEYKKSVVDYMISGYAKGETPNPDVMCNKEIKFGLFLEKALALGADYIATGHYIRVKNEAMSFGEIIRSRAGRVSLQAKSEARTSEMSRRDIEHIERKTRRVLLQAKDLNKDQSYFLWTLTQEQLKYCLFPIGEFTKPQVRALAKKYKLPTAEKPDSQGVCFIGEINVGEFLKEKLGKNPGPIKTMNDPPAERAGRTIGIHDGVIFYTIGQRKGIGIKGSLPGEQGKTYYVAAKDVETNTLFVAEGESENLFAKELIVKNINWILGTAPKLPLKCSARIRYRQPLQSCIIKNLENVSYTNDRWNRINVVFDVPQRAITPGQSAVFYLSCEAQRAKSDDKSLIMLGGGVIV